MEDLFEGLPIDTITTSMTINPPAAVIWAMYIAMAEKKGISRKVLAARSRMTCSRSLLPRRPSCARRGLPCA